MVVPGTGEVPVDNTDDPIAGQHNVVRGEIVVADHFVGAECRRARSPRHGVTRSEIGHGTMEAGCGRSPMFRSSSLRITSGRGRAHPHRGTGNVRNDLPAGTVKAERLGCQIEATVTNVAEKRDWMVGVHGPAVRRTVSPTRTTEFKVPAAQRDLFLSHHLDVSLPGRERDRRRADQASNPCRPS